MYVFVKKQIEANFDINADNKISSVFTMLVVHDYDQK